MKELSLNILDITENSTKAGASLVHITIEENGQTLTLTVSDDGCGMNEQTQKSVADPFFTTRVTRNVGLGIPLLKLAAEQTGGSVTISSRHIDEYPDSHGTDIQAVFYKNHIDFTPVGDITATVTTLIQGHPDVDFLFEHNTPEYNVRLDTRELRAVLGSEVKLNNFEVISWIGGYLSEQYPPAGE